MSPPGDPPSGRFRRGGDDPPSPRHVDHTREVTRPGSHVDLDATEDDGYPAPTTPVDALTDAAQAVGDAAKAVAAHAISRTEAEGIRMRLANLETWRAGDVDPWRLRLTGVADTNGRLGRLDATIEKLREDVGTSKERDAERAEIAQLRKDVGPTDERRKEREAVAAQRSDRKRVVAVLIAAASIAGGGIYTIRDRYDASVEARGADTQWRKGIEKQLDTLFSLFGLKPPTSGATP